MSVLSLIAGGADVNAKDEDGQTLLHLTYKIEDMKALLANGADVNAKGKNGRTSLHYRSEADGDIMKHLRARGPDEFAKMDAEIICRAEEYTVDVIKTLIDAGALVNAKDENGKTPLHLSYNIKVVRTLLDSGADVNAKDNDERTPLHYRCREDARDIVEALLNAGADIGIKDKYGKTPLDMVL